MGIRDARDHLGRRVDLAFYLGEPTVDHRQRRAASRARALLVVESNPRSQGGDMNARSG